MEGHIYSKLHQLSGSVVPIDLGEKRRAILEEARLAANGRAGETLVKEGALRLTILGFTAGASMADHQAGGPLSIEVLDGLIRVTVAGESSDVQCGDALVIEAGLRHAVLARTDAVVLLAIAMSGREA